MAKDPTKRRAGYGTVAFAAPTSPSFGFEDGTKVQSAAAESRFTGAGGMTAGLGTRGPPLGIPALGLSFKATHRAPTS